MKQILIFDVYRCYLTKYARSTNLARFDGVEQFSLILGVSISPWAFKIMGYKGCFIFRAAGNFLAIMYLRELNINLSTSFCRRAL